MAVLEPHGTVRLAEAIDEVGKILPWARRPFRGSRYRFPPLPPRLVVVAADGQAPTQGAYRAAVRTACTKPLLGLAF
jgi:hypothetical protein